MKQERQEEEELFFLSLVEILISFQSTQKVPAAARSGGKKSHFSSGLARVQVRLGGQDPPGWKEH